MLAIELFVNQTVSVWLALSRYFLLRGQDVYKRQAFFKLADVMSIEDAVNFMKQAAQKSYGKKGQDVVEIDVYKRQHLFHPCPDLHGF